MNAPSGVLVNRKLSGLTGACALAVAAVLLLSLSSCAHDQQLTGITVQPGAFVFGSPDPGLSANFTALGTYIHPPETKDITGSVTWSSNVPQLVTVTGGVVAPTGAGCGVITITASYSHGTGPNGNLIAGYSTVTVADATIPTCPTGATAKPVPVMLPDTVTRSPN
jgi:hypothetical protein